VIVAVAGPIMSGTSSVTKAAAAPAKPASFGEHLRRETGAQDRHALAEAGQKLVDGDADAFAKAVVEAAGWRADQPLIIDGVRHVQILQSLRELVFPVPIILAYVDVTPAVYAQRIEKKGKLSEALQFSDHPTEQQVKSRLAKIADIRVDNSGNVTDAVKSLIRDTQERLHMRRALQGRIIFPDFTIDPATMPPGVIAVVDMRSAGAAAKQWLNRLQRTRRPNDIFTLALVDDTPTARELATKTIHFFLPRPVRYDEKASLDSKTATLAAEIETHFPIVTSVSVTEQDDVHVPETVAPFWLTLGERRTRLPAPRPTRARRSQR